MSIEDSYNIHETCQQEGSTRYRLQRKSPRSRIDPSEGNGSRWFFPILLLMIERWRAGSRKVMSWWISATKSDLWISRNDIDSTLSRALPKRDRDEYISFCLSSTSFFRCSTVDASWLRVTWVSAPASRRPFASRKDCSSKSNESDIEGDFNFPNPFSVSFSSFANSLRGASILCDLVPPILYVVSNRRGQAWILGPNSVTGMFLYLGLSAICNRLYKIYQTFVVDRYFISQLILYGVPVGNFVHPKI